MWHSGPWTRNQTYKDCEIAHYVGDQPEWPFTFVRVAVPDQDGTFNSPHNPTIQHIDEINMRSMEVIIFQTLETNLTMPNEVPMIGSRPRSCGGLFLSIVSAAEPEEEALRKSGCVSRGTQKV